MILALRLANFKSKGLKICRRAESRRRVYAGNKSQNVKSKTTPKQINSRSVDVSLSLHITEGKITTVCQHTKY
jgi:hypothetical protein